jgi:hypothetical protein
MSSGPHGATPDRINRSEIAILSYQLDGFCRGLIASADAKLRVEATSLSLLKKLFSDAKKLLGDGLCISGWPDLGKTADAGDLIVYCETLRATIAAYIAPGELDQQRKAIGVRPDLHSG